ncbi:MAG: TrmH family RNA methyltransferase [Candidatus Paceibacterota bacterium]
MKKQETILIAHNIRSTHNVGSLFRTADAAGVSKLYLTGYTPCPQDRFGRKRKDIAKVALGAEESLAWENKEDVVALLNALHQKEYFIIALEQDERALDYREIKIPEDKIPVFVLGSEVEGLSSELLSLCDVMAEIPMKGEKESLNVSVALGIALFRILNI